MRPINNNAQIELTAAAFEQIKLMQEMDYTLEGMKFRLKIDGKGCDGFTYATGFSGPLDEDINLKFEIENKSLEIIMDPFTLHYCKEGTLDYLMNPSNHEDGFSFTNNNEHLYHGKFFEDESMVPPQG